MLNFARIFRIRLLALIRPNEKTHEYNYSHDYINDMAKLLIDKGADINVKDSTGKAALYYANQTGNKHLVRLLKEHIDIQTISIDKLMQYLGKADTPKKIEAIIEQNQYYPSIYK